MLCCILCFFWGLWLFFIGKDVPVEDFIVSDIGLITVLALFLIFYL